VATRGLPSAKAATQDERQLATLVDYPGLDEAGWYKLLGEAFELSASREFERLETALTHLLEQGHVLDARTLKRVHRIVAGEAELEHKAVEASTRIVKDLGEFATIAATYDVDRVKDRIRYGAFKKTIERWRASGKNVPLHWNHSGDAKNIIGSVEPFSMREIAGAGLYLKGNLDLEDSEVARDVWRSMRANTVGLSFGYLVLESHKRAEYNDLTELDLFEISITPNPANPNTRILEMKSQALAERRDLRRRCNRVELELALGEDPGALARRAQATELETNVAPSDAELRRKAAELGLRAPPRRPADYDAVRAATRDRMLNPLCKVRQGLAER
jgi:HK97 family phage prohead protease